ncbi:hypothetical protein [Dyella psychrodurans]|uniref:Uncharacterized protein n=1 Tax=Dyella psychrodurans TaxID=1927960 RepID=A0A370X2U1_9GAMM|nr:hypothetical protein [Dyella psychrodurans]RDS82600.1 hypothetical protein DWU99_14465 [Dyella psychrodurans]
MKQPGLDGRHRDKKGTIDLKHGNTKNKNLPTPIPGFGPDVTLKEMRDETGKMSEQAIRAAMRNRKS